MTLRTQQGIFRKMGREQKPESTICNTLPRTAPYRMLKKQKVCINRYLFTQYRGVSQGENSRLSRKFIDKTQELLQYCNSIYPTEKAFGKFTGAIRKNGHVFHCGLFLCQVRHPARRWNSCVYCASPQEHTLMSGKPLHTSPPALFQPAAPEESTTKTLHIATLP